MRSFYSRLQDSHKRGRWLRDSDPALRHGLVHFYDDPSGGGGSGGGDGDPPPDPPLDSVGDPPAPDKIDPVKYQEIVKDRRHKANKLKQTQEELAAKNKRLEELEAAEKERERSKLDAEEKAKADAKDAEARAQAAEARATLLERRNVVTEAGVTKPYRDTIASAMKLAQDEAKAKNTTFDEAEFFESLRKDQPLIFAPGGEPPPRTGGGTGDPGEPSDSTLAELEAQLKVAEARGDQESVFYLKRAINHHKKEGSKGS